MNNQLHRMLATQSLLGKSRGWVVFSGRAVLCLPLVVGGCLALGLSAMSGCQPPAKPEAKADRPLSSEQEFRDKLAELKMQREKSERAIARLEQRKNETVEFLKSKGVKSSADLAGDVNLKYAARELKGWSDEIEKLEKERLHYDEAISAIQAMLAELERKRINETVAMTEDEYIRLRKIVLDLNDRLEVDKQDVVADDELDSLLKEELGNKEPTPAGGG